MENSIDNLPEIYQDWLYLVALLGVAFVGLLIYDYLRRKSGARKFRR